MTTATQVLSPQRPLRADARRNRERLLAAARGVLAERGTNACMEEIARAANVGVGTLYRHFPSRVDLVEAVYRDDVEGLVVLAREVTEQLPPWEALVSWLQGFVRYANTKRAFLAELQHVLERAPDLALCSRDRVRAAADLVLSRAQDAGAARTDLDAGDLMQLAYGVCLASPAAVERHQRLLDVVLDGIRTP